MAGSNPELALTILDYVSGHGRVTMIEAVQKTGANRNTLKCTSAILWKSDTLFSMASVTRRGTPFLNVLII